MSTIFLLCVVSLLALYLFLTLPAVKLAEMAKRGGPGILAGLGVLLILGRQTMFGSLAIFAAINLWRRNRSVRPISTSSSGSKWSSVRSASLEMELDHETGEMNGVVLLGIFEGNSLADLDQSELLTLRMEIAADHESIALLDAYLDRRFSAWREHADADGRPGEAGSASSGPMSKQEAYEVLGLPVGASVADIRQAHRRLMKTAHPDSGGSTFLASKINEAKDVLLRSHS